MRKSCLVGCITSAKACRRMRLKDTLGFSLANASGDEEVSERVISKLKKRFPAEQMEKGQARAAELQRLIEQKSAE